MNVTQVSLIAAKDMRARSRSAKRNLERAEALLQSQMDAFAQYQYDPKAPSLDALITQAQTYNSGSDEQLRILNKAIKYHGGLGAMIAKRFGRRLAYGEVLSYMWEAFDQVLNGWYKETASGMIYMEGWNPRKGRASTFLKARTCSIIWDKIYHGHTRGAVFVPMRNKTFTAVGIGTDQELAAVLAEMIEPGSEWDVRVDQHSQCYI